MTANPGGFASLDEAADAIQAYNPRRGRPRDHSGLSKNLRRDDHGRWHWHWEPQDPGRRERPAVARSGDAGHRGRGPAVNCHAAGLGRGLRRRRREDVLRFRALVPAAQTVDVAGAGHMVAGDRNDRFADAIGQFLARIPG